MAMLFLVFMKHFCTVSVLCHETPVAKTQRFRPLTWYMVEPGHFVIGLLISLFLNVQNLNNIDL